MRHSITLSFTFFILSLTGCGLLSEDPTDPDVNLLPLPAVAACGNLTEAQQTAGDALVAEATSTGINSMQNLFDELEDGEWDNARALTPAQAHAKFKEALIAAPGHCAALFGLTLTSLAMTFDDNELNQFVDKLYSWLSVLN